MILLDGYRLVALLPLMEVNSFMTGKRAISLPFSDFCQILTRRENQFDQLLRTAIDYGTNRHWRYIELRSPGVPLADTNSYSHYYSHVLNLTKGERETFSNFRSSVKRNIKKAVREGVEVSISQSIEALITYYDMHVLTRKRHGLPPQPLKFFLKLHEHLISRGNGLVVLASYRGEAIAGGVYLHFGKEAVYKYGASNKAYQPLRANNLVMWEAIKFYIKSGFERFNFGRTDPNNDGLLQFKSGWGAVEKNLRYYRYDLAIESFIQGQSQRLSPEQIFRNMPLPILKAAGRLLYRHFG